MRFCRADAATERAGSIARHAIGSWLLDERPSPTAGTKAIQIARQPFEGVSGPAAKELVGNGGRSIYGVGNIVENAVDFAHSKVEIMAHWDERTLEVEVKDDGLSSAPSPRGNARRALCHDTSSRHSTSRAAGLGFFIAKRCSTLWRKPHLTTARHQSAAPLFAPVGRGSVEQHLLAPNASRQPSGAVT